MMGLLQPQQAYVQCRAVCSNSMYFADESLDCRCLLLHSLHELMHALVMKQSCKRDRQLRLSQGSLRKPQLQPTNRNSSLR